MSLAVAVCCSLFIGAAPADQPQATIEAHVGAVTCLACAPDGALLASGGKQAVLGWKVDKGMQGDVCLDGLSVVAVIRSSDTLGLDQTGPSRAVLIVDEKASPAQRDALVRLAKEQGGKLVAHVVAVRRAAVDLTVCECKGGACAKLKAGEASLNVRRGR